MISRKNERENTYKPKRKISIKGYSFASIRLRNWQIVHLLRLNYRARDGKRAVALWYRYLLYRVYKNNIVLLDTTCGGEGRGG